VYVHPKIATAALLLPPSFELFRLPPRLLGSLTRCLDFRPSVDPAGFRPGVDLEQGPAWRRGAARDAVERRPRASPPRCRSRPSSAEASRAEERRGLTHRGGRIGRISLRTTFLPARSSARCRSASAADACTLAHLVAARRSSASASSRSSLAVEATSSPPWRPHRPSSSSSRSIPSSPPLPPAAGGEP
jgi:hypothetical protein